MAAPHPDLNASDLKRAKKRARLTALARRAGADPALGEALADHLLSAALPPPGAVVAGYWPIGEEIDIRPLLFRLIARGHVIVLPETPRRGEALRFRRFAPGEALMREPFGTFTPKGEPLTPDFIIVPLLAFDRKGRRLGYGGGYYDRTLAALPGVCRIGAAFAIQEVLEVPAGPGDVRLPAVATEAGVIICADEE